MIDNLKHFIDNRNWQNSEDQQQQQQQESIDNVFYNDVVDGYKAVSYAESKSRQSLDFFFVAI